MIDAGSVVATLELDTAGFTGGIENAIERVGSLSGAAQSAALSGRALSDAMLEVKSGVLSGAEGAASAMEGLARAAASAMNSAVGSAQKSGAAMVTGLIGGAESRRGALVSKFTSLAQAAILAANRKLGIQSPSKVFQKIGAQTVEGFALGVSGNIGRAQDSMGRILEAGAFTPSQITGTGSTFSSTSVVNNNYSQGGAPINITFPGEIHVSDAAEIRSFERKMQRAANDIQYGLGARG